MDKKIVSLLLIVGQSCFLHAQNNDVRIIPENAVGIKPLPVRKVRTELGITQQPNEKINWLIEARFGMFIHWGLYSGVGKGEWYMENSVIMAIFFVVNCSVQKMYSTNP